jgi:hypothetical protein
MLKRIKEWFIPKERSGLAEANNMFIGVIIGERLKKFLLKLDIKGENYVKR